MLSAQQLKLGYDDKVIVPQLSLEVDTGRIHCLIKSQRLRLECAAAALAGVLKHGHRRDAGCYRHRN